MWGSHIDTIRVVHSYVLVRRQIPQRSQLSLDPLIVPEIHTTFKALRWLCDEKQIFDDGSMLHTSFLTIFYALALAEVYRSWEPARLRIDRLYDDVVWFSPVRTTPERSKRLAAEIQIAELQDRLHMQEASTAGLQARLTHMRTSQAKTVLTVVLVISAIVGGFFVGNLFGLSKTKFEAKPAGDYLQYVAISLSILVGLIAVVWNFERLTGRKDN